MELTQQQIFTYNNLLHLESWLSDGEEKGYIHEDEAQRRLEQACEDAEVTLNDYRAWAAENA